MTSSIPMSFTIGSWGTPVEEQTATAQEITANILEVHDKAAVLKDKTHHTGRSFYDISVRIDALRMKALTFAKNADSSVILNFLNL